MNQGVCVIQDGEKKIEDVYLQTLEDWTKSKCWMSEMMDKGGGTRQKDIAHCT